jgi:RNA polymerase sigma-B factor
MAAMTATLNAKVTDPPAKDPKPEAEVLRLLRRFRMDRDEQARETLVLMHRSLVEKVARRFIDTGEPMDDLVQEGFLGLLTAIDLFDMSFSVKFSTYAHHLITGQIRHYLRDKGTIIREPAWSQDLRRTVKKASANLSSELRREPTVAEIAAAVNLTEEALGEILAAEQVAKVVSLDGFGEDDAPAVDPDKIRSLRHVTFQMPLEDRIMLEELIANLKQIEQRVVHDFFFMDLSQTEIAKTLGVSCNYVSHLLKSALKKMGKSMAYTELQERQLRQKSEAVTSNDADASIVERATNLYTGEYYGKRLDEEIARARRYAQDLATVWIRCENFDEHQGRLGTDWTENTLYDIGATLRDGVRKCDVVAHLGGGTFAIILPHTGEGAKIVRDRLLSSLGANEFGRGANLQFRGVYLLVPRDGSSARPICESAAYQLSMPLVSS